MATAADYQQSILLEVGAGLDGKTPAEKRAKDFLSSNIAAYWAMWDDMAWAPRLQYYYCKRQCLRILMGQLRLKIDAHAGEVSESLSQIFQNLSTLNQINDADLELVTKQAMASRRGVVGQTNARAPITVAPLRTPFPVARDPNDNRYLGSPF